MDRRDFLAAVPAAAAVAAALPPLDLAQATEQRPFPVPGLLADVQRALDAVPVDKRLAVVAYADRDQAGLAYMHRIRTGWSLMVDVKKPWSGKLEARAALVVVG